MSCGGAEERNTQYAHYSVLISLDANISHNKRGRLRCNVHRFQFVLLEPEPYGIKERSTALKSRARGDGCTDESWPFPPRWQDASKVQTHTHTR